MGRYAAFWIVFVVLALGGETGCRRRVEASPGAVACTPENAEERVLFLGNSYVATSNLPATFEALAASGHRCVRTAMVAPGGATLQDHLASPATGAALDAEPWTIVLLQEQSVLPAYDGPREHAMYPAVRALVARARARNARPMLLSTWARRDGLPDDGFPDYASMQARLDEAYDRIGRETGAAVVHAGAAWRLARAWGDATRVYLPDGSHPSPSGTYLNACVLYASIFHATPVGLAPGLGLDETAARELQTIAERAVFTGVAP